MFSAALSNLNDMVKCWMQIFELSPSCSSEQKMSNPRKFKKKAFWRIGRVVMIKDRTM